MLKLLSKEVEFFESKRINLYSHFDDLPVDESNFIMSYENTLINLAESEKYYTPEMNYLFGVRRAEWLLHRTPIKLEPRTRVSQ